MIVLVTSVSGDNIWNNIRGEFRMSYKITT